MCQTRRLTLGAAVLVRRHVLSSADILPPFSCPGRESFLASLILYLTIWFPLATGMCMEMTANQTKVLRDKFPLFCLCSFFYQEKSQLRESNPLAQALELDKCRTYLNLTPAGTAVSGSELLVWNQCLLFLTCWDIEGLFVKWHHYKKNWLMQVD